MKFALIVNTIFVLALVGVEGRGMRAANLSGEDLEDDFAGLSSLSLSLPLSLSMPIEELVAAQLIPPKEGKAVIVSPPSTSPTSSISSSNTKTYIVTFDDDDTVPPAKRCATLAASVGGTVGRVYSHALKGCSMIVPMAPEEDQTMQAQATFMTLSDSPVVMTVEENQIVSLDPVVVSNNTFPSVSSQVQAGQAPAAAPSWGLDRINQCSSSLDGKTTKQDATGVAVFILDTGIFADHVEFKGQISSSDSCHFTAYAGLSPAKDKDGHGTHVAGTVCGATYGVASNCRLCSVKVLDDQRKGYTEGIIAGWDHVVAKCVGSKLLCVANGSVRFPKSAAHNKAVAGAVAEGIVVVVAAGNDNIDACNVSPASELSAITVGNVDDKDKKAADSNYGPCVDVYAPGEKIKSAGITSTTVPSILSGTSMAAPHVAGIAAGMRSANKYLSPTQIRNAIVYSGVDIPPGWLAIVKDVSCSASCSSGKIPFEVRIFTDETPLETAWTLTTKKYTIDKSPEYQDGLMWHVTQLCLAKGKYDFTITDKKGDGICCGPAGNGEYALVVRGRHIASGGAFGYNEKISFEVK